MILAIFVIVITVTGIQLIRGKSRVTPHVLLMGGLVLIMSVWATMTVNASLGILTFFYYFPAIILFMLPERQKWQTLDFVTKGFSILMAISLLVFVAIKFIDITPWFGNFELKNNDFYPAYKNYGVLLYSADFFSNIVYRFNGPFLEPGHLATVSVLLIVANRYDFKKQPLMWILLLCIVLSMSLAGYVILIAGYLMLKIKNHSTFIISVILVLFGWLFFTQIWNGGANPVNEAILSRLEYDESKGIAGNNRTSRRTDVYYEKVKSEGKLWTGIGSIKDNSQVEGAGYKIYFIRFGIVSALLVLLFYRMLIPRYANKRFAYIFLLLIFLMFLQRAYPWWWSWLLCYTLSIGISDRTFKVLQSSNLALMIKKFLIG